MTPSAVKNVIKPDNNQSEEFSLVLGGPLYQLSVRAGLIRPPFGNLGWRIAVITLLAWLPLVCIRECSSVSVHSASLVFPLADLVPFSFSGGASRSQSCAAASRPLLWARVSGQRDVRLYPAARRAQWACVRLYRQSHRSPGREIT